MQQGEEEQQQEQQPSQEPIKEFELISAEIGEILFDPTNPNVMTEEQMNGMRKSMQMYGYLAPVILDQNYKICDGEHRVLIYKEMGLTHIPAYRINLDSEADRRQLRQVMNKLHGYHDKQKDSDELMEILQSSSDRTFKELSELLGKPQDDLYRQVLRYHPSLDYVTPENEADIDRLVEEEMKRIVPDTALSEMYELGRHRIICADSSDPRSVEKLLSHTKVDMLLTDPPYGVNYGGKNEFLNRLDRGNRIQEAYANDELDRDYRPFYASCLAPIPFNEEDGNTIYVFMSGYHLHDLRMAMEDQSVTWGDYLVWIKNNHVLSQKDYNPQHEFVVYGWKGKHKFYGDTGSTTILEYDKPQTSRLHPTTKPLDILKKLLRDGSQENMNVYDPFLGSGSTLLACEMLNRTCYGIEIDPHYVDVAVKRWEKYTGRKAEKVIPSSSS
jgi:DNA modification methylase